MESSSIAQVEQGEGLLPGLAPLVLGAQRGRAARDYLNDARDRLHELHLGGATGSQIVELWTAVVDHVVCTLFESAREQYRERSTTLDQKCTLIAQGGYGRGELNPWSDIDLLFLYPQRVDAYVETVTESVLYALWDTGMTVGQAVRSVRDCVSLAADDFKVKTALLDTRMLAGDEDLYREFASVMEKDVLKKNAQRFFDEKVAENEERHRKHGDAVFIVEPHLKEGEGGLRDIHTANWLAKVKYQVRDLEELVAKGVVAQAELEEVHAARDFLFGVRNALHFISGRHQDQLTFEYQERIAAELGFVDDEHAKGVEKFMRTYYLHAAAVNRFSDDLIALCTETSLPARWMGRLASREIRSGVRIVSGELNITDAGIFDDDPTLLLRVMADAQRHGVELSAGSRRWIRAKASLLDNDALRCAAGAARAFLDILNWKHGVHETLANMHKLGVLGAYLPEFENLRCMAQYDRYHIYTVDEHTLRGVRNIERLRRGEFKGELPLLTSVVREIDDIEVLYLAMIYHDIGKGQGGDHSNKGADLALAAAQRLGLNADATEHLEFLVRFHLIMHHLATRRDIHEPKLVSDFAQMVGSLNRLRKLYVLTYADLCATNPKLWNSWQDSLLAELYELTMDSFERGQSAESGQEERAVRIRQRVITATAAEDEPRMREFLAEMPDRYVLSMPEESIPHHFELVRRLDEDDYACRVEHFPERDFSELTVVARNQWGLFAKLTGVLRAKGLSISGAHAATGAKGLAVDVFRIAHTVDAELACSDDRWDAVVAQVGRVLDGSIEVADVVANATRPSVLDQRGAPRVVTEVVVDNDTSPDFTIIDVSTTDRLGVLYAMTSALLRLGLRIHLAKITTSVDRVLDVFYVSDEGGAKVSEDSVDRVRDAILHALQPLVESETASA